MDPNYDWCCPSCFKDFESEDIYPDDSEDFEDEDEEVDDDI